MIWFALLTGVASLDVFSNVSPDTRPIKESSNSLVGGNYTRVPSLCLIMEPSDDISFECSVMTNYQLALSSQLDVLP